MFSSVKSLISRLSISTATPTTNLVRTLASKKAPTKTPPKAKEAAKPAEAESKADASEASTEATVNVDADPFTESNAKYVISEELPPIVPRYGFWRDPNVYTTVQQRRIRDYFKIGLPPRMMVRPVKGPLVMRLVKANRCKSRPFYRLAVTRKYHQGHDPITEDLGNVDPMPNIDNQIMIALNMDRVKYWLAQEIPFSSSAGRILAIAGVLPASPAMYFKNISRQKKQAEWEKKQLEAAAKASAEKKPEEAAAAQ